MTPFKFDGRGEEKKRQQKPLQDRESYIGPKDPKVHSTHNYVHLVWPKQSFYAF